MKYNILLFLTAFSLIALVSASPYSSSTGKSPYSSNIIQDVEINYSLIPTVNNTQYFQGYTPTTLYDYYKGLLETYFNGIYCKLTGCTMTGNLEVQANVTADRYITTNNNSNGVCSNSSGDTFFGYIEGVC